MEAPAFRIRHLRAEDCGHLCVLLKEQQELQNIKRQIPSSEDLRKNGFGNGTRFNCLVAEHFISGRRQARLIGYSMYHCYFSGSSGQNAMLVEDAYEAMGYRNLGVQATLMKFMCKIAVENNCTQVDWFTKNSNATVNTIYRSYGAVNITSANGVQQYRFDRKSMDAYIYGNQVDTDLLFKTNTPDKERNFVI